MKCIYGYCEKENQLLSLEGRNAIVPLECDIGQLRGLFSYFQYRAPNIESVQSPLLDVSRHADVLNEMLRGNPNYRFVSHSSNTDDALRDCALFGSFICTRCKRFMCKRSGHSSKRLPTRGETDLECLLRHLRNSLAHGNVFLFHGGNYITVCFVDINDKKKITARILCTQADLRKWKDVLERAMQAQEDQHIP